MGRKIIDSLRLSLDNRTLSIVAFVCFSGWMLAFPFEGQVLYSLAAGYGVDVQPLLFGSVASHLVGLVASGYLIGSMRAAKNLLLYSCVFCVASSSLFFFAPALTWYSLWPASALSGMCIAAWAFYYRAFTPRKQRLQTAAVCLIYSNLLMIAVNLMAVHLLPVVGLVAAIMLLFFSFCFTLGLPEQAPPLEVEPIVASGAGGLGFVRPLAFLCLFIFVLTINSGLMYQVINPAFAHHQWLVSWYWALPYVLALHVMQRFPERINRSYALYLAIAMIGLAFLGFMTLDRSVPSYLLINTLMMGACGVFDLFWWSILGGMLNLARNPARIMGTGLAANVLGVLLGGLLGSRMAASSSPQVDSSVLALAIVMIALATLPLLHQRLTLLLRDHAFLTSFTALPVHERTTALNSVVRSSCLSEREQQVVDLLSRGRTYRLIAAELYLSENTVKTHVKNAYSKLGVKSRTELVQLLMKQDSLPED